MKAALIALICLFWSGKLLAQDSIQSPFYGRFKSLDLLLGIHWQGNVSTNKTLRYYEIGIARARYLNHRHGTPATAVYLSEEVHFSNTGNIYGTKLGAWLHWILDAGLAFIYYTDLDQGNFRIRPELGWGMGKTRLVVGYNLPTIGNKKFEALTNNNLQISLQTGFALKKKVLKAR